MQNMMEGHLALLTNEQATSLIHSLGLGPVCSLLQNQGDGEVLSNIPGMDPPSLQSFLVCSFKLWECSFCWIFLLLQVKLDALLAAPDALQLAQWRLLISGAHKKAVQRRALDAVLSIYSQLYQAVHNPKNGYDHPSAIMPRTPDQVRSLLG